MRFRKENHEIKKVLQIGKKKFKENNGGYHSTTVESTNYQCKTLLYQ
jgi:hypothetical protein